MIKEYRTMPLEIITKEAFKQHYQKAKRKSFIQSVEMSILLKKRGYNVEFIGFFDNNQLQVSALLFSTKMAGGPYLEINSGPVVTNYEFLPKFYEELKIYAKQLNAMELVVKPYDIYQVFNSKGDPISTEKKELVSMLTNLNYQFDGLQKDYPGGEGDWHFVKDLDDLTEETLLKSFIKQGKSLVKKAKTFGIELHKLKRNELYKFKQITSSTSERRNYNDKTLDYYEKFYDSFGSNAEFIIASINFKNYLEHLQNNQNELSKKIKLLQDYLEENNHSSEKKLNQFRELSSQFETFEIRKNEVYQLLKSMETKVQY